MDDGERIAQLETQHRELYRRMDEMQKDVREIKQAVTSWRDVMLGVALTVSFLWTGALGLWTAFKHKLGA